jgi:hypothetical protein
LKHPHNASLAQAALNAQPPFLEGLSNEIGCARLFVAQLRVGVDASSQGLDFVSRGQDFRDEFHDAFDCGMVLNGVLVSNEPFYA